MKRWVRLGVRLVALSLAALAAVGASGQTQEPKTVRIDTLSVMDTLYHLSGGGGNSLAFIDEINGGVVLIDTKRPGWGPPVRDALDGVTDLPVRTIINTHAHPDHAGSNGEFGTAVSIVAHENTKANMTRMDLYSGANAAEDPEGMQGTETTTTRMAQEVSAAAIGAARGNLPGQNDRCYAGRFHNRGQGALGRTLAGRRVRPDGGDHTSRPSHRASGSGAESGS